MYNIMKFLKNNKGDVSAINFVIVMFACITLISFLGGFYDIVAKRHALTRCTNHVARVAARQGGFQSSPPDDWDAEFKYVVTSEMVNFIKSSMTAAAITDWDIFLNDNSIYTNLNADFKTDIEVKMVMRYHWGLWRPAHRDSRGLREYVIVRTVKSEKFLRHFNDIEYDKQ